MNLRERLPSCAPTPVTEQTVPVDQLSAAKADSTARIEDHDQDDTHSEASSSGLPPPIITGADYDAFMCAACVASIPILRRWAGTKGVMMVVRQDPGSAWNVLDGVSLPNDSERGGENGLVDMGQDCQTGEKRPHSRAGFDFSDAKRPRISNIDELSPADSSSQSCIAPPENSTAQRVFALVGSDDISQRIGHGDLFLTDGWRSRWCRCSSVSAML